MKYAFIQRHRQVWPITVQCRVLGVSVSGYHAHAVRQSSAAPRRHLSDAALLVHLQAVHAQTRGGYGWPRVWRELRGQGVRVGKQRVQTLRQKHGIRARGKRRFKVTTTDSQHDLPIAPNLLDRQFTVTIEILMTPLLSGIGHLPSARCYPPCNRSQRSSDRRSLSAPLAGSKRCGTSPRFAILAPAVSARHTPEKSHTTAAAASVALRFRVSIPPLPRPYGAYFASAVTENRP